MTMNKVMTMSLLSTNRNNSNRCSHTRTRSKKKKKKSGNNDSSVKKIKRITSSGTLSLTDLDLDCSDHSSRDDNSNNNQDIIVHVQQEGVIKSQSTEKREATTQKKKKKVVRFSTVHIREYQVCLGDNPSVARGAPLSLDWQYENEIRIDLTEYDEQQQHTTIKREHHDDADFKRSSLERIQLFKQLGYSRQEIHTATQRVQKIRQQRFHTRRQCQRREALRAFFFCALPRQKKKATAMQQ
mmetsp:Transcript_35754/g.38741  ORF Transcript_35754/g.38741 Transcript_35754/m.38741 type:complete len:241 (-) Transcript_35754:97-819(-)